MAMIRAGSAMFTKKRSRGSPIHPNLSFRYTQVAQLSVDLWPPCRLARFPTPERCETRTVPAKDGLRLNDLRPPSRLGQSRVIQTNKARSLPRSRRRGGARLRAMLS
jgi:hypothetical protein